MGTVKDYYLSDGSGSFRLSRTEELGHKDKDGRLKISYSILSNMEANARYASIYVPASDLFESPVRVAMQQFDLMFEDLNSSVQTMMSVDDGEPPLSSDTLVFTNRLFIYSEDNISEADRAHFVEVSSNRGWDVKFRLPAYAIARSKGEKPEAFISHDSRDKLDLAEPLAIALIKNRHSVWFDEFSLRVGDSLRESIEKGLRDCRKCIFLITPHFLANGGWAKREYDSIFTRELVEEKKLILPVWSGVTKKQVFEYSPILADRVACIWDNDVAKVAKSIGQAL